MLVCHELGSGRSPSTRTQSLASWSPQNQCLLKAPLSLVPVALLTQPPQKGTVLVSVLLLRRDTMTVAPLIKESI